MRPGADNDEADHGSRARARLLQSIHDDARLAPGRLRRRRRIRRTLVASVVFAVLATGATLAYSAQLPDYSVRERVDGVPVRWSSCAPIRYVVNWDNAPPGARRVLHRAVTQVEQASGMDLAFVGATDEQPSHARLARDTARYGDGWAPVLVAWTRRADGDHALARNVFGRAEPVAATTAAGGRAWVSGSLLVNADMLEEELAPPLDFVLRHELGHLLGLGHARRHRGEVMHADPSRANATVTWGRGDRHGLRELGRGPCVQAADRTSGERASS